MKCETKMNSQYEEAVDHHDESTRNSDDDEERESALFRVGVRVVRRGLSNVRSFGSVETSVE